MIDIAAAFQVVTRDLTDLIGLLERNLASLDRISTKYRRKRIARRLDQILNRFVSWRHSQIYMLMHLAERVAMTEDLVDYRDDSSDYLEGSMKFGSGDLHLYIESLLETRDLLDEFQKDIVSVDYKLYETLQDALVGRIDLVSGLMDKNNLLSPKKLKQIYIAYSELVLAMQSLKKELQEASRSVLINKTVSRQKIQKHLPTRKESSVKKGK